MRELAGELGDEATAYTLAFRATAHDMLIRWAPILERNAETFRQLEMRAGLLIPASAPAGHILLSRAWLEWIASCAYAAGTAADGQHRPKIPWAALSAPVRE